MLPYMYPDLNTARDLVTAGASAVMPLAAPIGSNKGLATRIWQQRNSLWNKVHNISFPVGIGAAHCQGNDLRSRLLHCPAKQGDSHKWKEEKIKMKINGAEKQYPDGITISEMLKREGFQEEQVAVVYRRLTRLSSLAFSNYC